MCLKKMWAEIIPFQNGPNPNAPWHAPSTSSICQHSSQPSQTGTMWEEAEKRQILQKKKGGQTSLGALALSTMGCFAPTTTSSSMRIPMP